MSKVLLKDIAKELNISVATVSIVLSGKATKGRVSDFLAKKIKDKARELNYRPNRIARSLRVGKSKTLGLIVADISNPFFANLAFYIQERAEKKGYVVMIVNSNESAKKIGGLISVLKSRQVDGYIIVPTEKSENYIEQLIKAQTPVVLLDRTFPDLEVSTVLIDNYKSSTQAVAYLYNLGCRRIAYVSYNNNLIHMKERERGYVEFTKKNNIFNNELLRYVDYSSLEDDIYTQIKSILELKPRVDGLLFASNSISLIALKTMLKFKITYNIEIVCFDESDVFDFYDRKIPYILQPIEKMANKSVDILLEDIENGTQAPVHIKYQTKLMNI